MKKKQPEKNTQSRYYNRYGKVSYKFTSPAWELCKELSKPNNPNFTLKELHEWEYLELQKDKDHPNFMKWHLTKKGEEYLKQLKQW